MSVDTIGDIEGDMCEEIHELHSKAEWLNLFVHYVDKNNKILYKEATDYADRIHFRI